MEFKRLELTGFKSFVEKTNFLIEKGLTGIVGPNGCGKSNIVEAIRWCMGETSAKSMRGTGMEDVIFSGTENKTSKNIAEVSLTLNNSDNSGPMQFKEVDIINVKRRIEKDKGSRYFINGKEVRARDAQTFFADLSTGAHSPSMISQGKIGALVTAKPTDRRAILEEAAGISGIHARKHESELRLNSAENNLKRADELRRQQEKQLANLQRQAEEAARYKLISEEIKKVEAGLYYLKLVEIDNEIKLENEINVEAEDKVEGFNNKINELDKEIKDEIKRITPIREKNIENLSKIQRLNLELKALDEENERIKDDIASIKNSVKVLDEDIDREKSIVIDANSNEKRLREEKNELIETDSKYYETEKISNQDLETAKLKLKSENERIDSLLKNFNSEILLKNTENIDNIKKQIEKAKNLVEENNTKEAINILDECLVNLSYAAMKFKDVENNSLISTLNTKSEQIKKIQEEYAKTYSKNQNIKKESVKRNERINIIDKEIESWRNILNNSEKMVIELSERKNKHVLKLNVLEQQPQSQAEKKGKISENLRISEKDKNENEILIEKTDDKINQLRNELNTTKENSIEIRERKASSGATIDGLNKRRNDLLERVMTELNLEEDKLLRFSNLEKEDRYPDTVEQEELLDEKKREREKLGSVNLRADEETSKYEMEIKKMEQDRRDLVTAIVRLKESITELNQKGRERLIEAFEKVNRKFNEVYTKLFNGGSAKLELVDSEDPLEAGLEMLVSPPGKRLQSITLLSGGEQALTALSLIFAVFLTNPAPICVLDEVDAPLDDTNVDRFCTLVEEMAKTSMTKFLIITHHRMTMARVGRLFGVTMPEKGISQLVSVDLERAVKIKENE